PPLRLCAVRNKVCSSSGRLSPSPSFSRARRSRLSAPTCSSSSSEKVAMSRWISLSLSMRSSLSLGGDAGKLGAEGVEVLGGLLGLAHGRQVLLGHLVDVPHRLVDLRHPGRLLSGRRH